MLDRKQWHVSITDDAIIEAVHRPHVGQGFCLMCGNSTTGVAPGAIGYECEACGKPQVYGTDELLMCLRLSWGV